MCCAVVHLPTPSCCTSPSPYTAAAPLKMLSAPHSLMSAKLLLCFFHTTHRPRLVCLSAPAQALLSALAASGGAASSRDVCGGVEAALPALLERIADNNARTRDATRDTIVSLARTPEGATALRGLAPQLVRPPRSQAAWRPVLALSLIHISEPTRLRRIAYAVFWLKKKNINNQ